MAVKVHNMVFWVMMLHSVVVGYQHFERPRCHHLYPENGGYKVIWAVGASIFILKLEAIRSSKMLVSYCVTTWHHNAEDYNFSIMCGIVTQVLTLVQ